MKKFNFLAVMAVVLTLFSACQQEELEVNEPQIAGAREDVPDVYTENGYLAFKSTEVADSIAELLNIKSLSDQVDWEKSLNFKSARTYRAELNQEVLDIDEFGDFEKKVQELVKKGYFNLDKSCMDYPFSRETWASILNKDGVLKIGEVLYSFDKTGCVAVHNGTLELLAMAKRGDKLPDGVESYTSPEDLKSVSLDNFGTYFGERKWNGKHVLDVSLVYGVILTPKYVYDPRVGHHRLVDLPDAVKYELYCHQRVKRWYGWFDANTHLSYKQYATRIGGNYNSDKGFTYDAVNILNASPSIVTSSNDLANHYIKLYSAIYPFSWDFVDPTPPSIAPVITSIIFDVWTGKVGSEGDCINMVIN